MIDCNKNKNLEVGNKISFNLGHSLIDGVILEKSVMDKGNIGFLIETDDGKLCKIKHRRFDLFYINKN